ncbi:MAG: hypothetical protein K8H90_00865, partial [Thermoanaerobaculia bacterium]|nr:hypothetical protein [Thermoanaerobaculia bacterium]
RRVAFPMRVKTRRHRRQIQVIGPRVVAPVEDESYHSVVVETHWQTFGELFGELTPVNVAPLADRLVEAFRAREAPIPAGGATSLVLGHHAAAVLLHEGVAHALEADTLAATGPPEAALGIELASSLVSVIDDPGAAPDGVKRQTDDEGMPVVRRWLLRDGVVEQILADRSYSERCGRFEPGAGRRSDRHQSLGPRSTYLEMLPGEGSLESLFEGVGEGLYAAEADRGLLDPRTGIFFVSFPHGRRIRNGVLAEPVGRFLVRSRVADLLSRVVAVGGESAAGGAGWCAKGGQRLPVWASTVPLVIEAAEVMV